MENESTNEEIKRLLQENHVLLDENNALLKKIHRNALIEFAVRVCWYLLLIGLPFIIYFYMVEPYFSAIGFSFEQLLMIMQAVPFYENFTEAIQQANQQQ